ncbi:MAG: nuclear protein localization protein 4 [Chaenotheca gracillima]|nr:MAG: nuclear protein localization protein 4 [Chaenotheca gracillima]
MVDWVSLVVPVAYLGILVGSLATFSSLYRKNKAAKAASLEPWFPPHLQRNIYLSLLHLEPESGKEKAPAVPESVLKAALLRRATEDVARIVQIRNAKQALSTLLQRGSVGDDLWQGFQRAEKEIEEELRDVVTEANAFAPNWGQTIFQSASEMTANSMLRKRTDEIQEQAKSEKEWWEKRRESIQTEFMKELDDTNSTNKEPSIKQKPPVVPSAQEKVGSDEDTVLVEGGGPAVSGGKAGGGAGKKKKGKK